MDGPPIRMPPVTKNCAYVLIFDFEYQEFVEYLEKVVKEAETEVKMRCDTYSGGCLFSINMPSRTVKNFVPKHGIGYAYVWFTKPEVLALLVGLDYDGSEIPAASTITDSPIEIEATSVKDELFSGNWSEPIKIGKCFKSTVETNSKSVPIFKYAIEERVPRTMAEGTLYCPSVLPEKVDTEYLMKLFLPYATTGPLRIVITTRRNAYIEFPFPDDAYFALSMNRKHLVEENLIISFTHSNCKAPGSRPDDYPQGSSCSGGRDGNGSERHKKARKPKKNQRY